MKTMRIKILVRAIKRGHNDHLAMFDSKRQGNIDALITEAKPGDTISWVLDSLSGIDHIEKIYTTARHPRILRTHINFPGPFTIKIPVGANIGLTRPYKEKYLIKCKLSDGRPITIDPFIKIPPSPTKS
jgi:hypothetical protein